MSKNVLWALGGGKGGVGKSLLTASMGTILARMGKSVIAVDASLGVPHLHACLGVKAPSRTLVDVIDGRCSLEEALSFTSEPGLRFLSCAGDQLGAADLPQSEFEALLEMLSGLRADVIIADLGGGTSFRVLDLFNTAHEGIIITTPDQSAMQNVYGFIRNAVCRRIQQAFPKDELVMAKLNQWWRRLDPARPPTMISFYQTLYAADPGTAEHAAAIVDSFRPSLLINMADAEEDQRAAEIIHSASRKFLNVDVRFCGLVLFDPSARRTAQNLITLDFSNPERKAWRQIQQVVGNMLNSDSAVARLPNAIEADVSAAPSPGLNDNLSFLGRELHVQTEDLGHMGGCIATQVFCNGRVLFSTRSEYPKNASDAQGRAQVSEQMRAQHLSVIREIEGKMMRLHSA